VAHVAAIRIFRLKHFYSPGLVTAVGLLLPISLYAFAYAIRHDLMQPISWLFASLYLLFGLTLAQQFVVRASGTKYTDFLKNVRSALFGARDCANHRWEPRTVATHEILTISLWSTQLRSCTLLRGE
jgi:hypothetical protein